MSALSPARRQLVDRYSALTAQDGLLVTSVSGSVTVMHAKFDAFEGSGPGLPCSVLTLCTGGGGAAHRKGSGFSMNDVWAPGKLGLALPHQAASGSSPPMSALGIAFDMADIPACHGAQIGVESLAPAANRLFDDPLAAWMMTALSRDAEAHGAASSFFDHGLSLLLHRISQLAGAMAPAGAVTRAERMSPVLDMIEERLDEDLRVKDMAPLLGLDARSFTRSFKQTTGSTPFAYLTRRRMERAMALLRDGLSVTQTAIAVGYANPAKFAAAFRRHTGRSPSGWLRETRLVTAP